MLANKLMAIASLLIGLLLCVPAGAEVNEVRFARQLGLGYLQFYVMQEHGLVEKQAQAAGLGKITTQYTGLGTPTASPTRCSPAMSTWSASACRLS